MFEAWHLRQQQVHDDEEALRQLLRALPDTQRKSFYKRYSPKLKDPDTYAALNWFFIAGLHNFYLGQWLLGLADLCLMLLGVVLLFLAEPYVGIAVIGLVILIELPALFRSQIIVANYNNQLGFRTLQSLP